MIKKRANRPHAALVIRTPQRKTARKPGTPAAAQHTCHLRHTRRVISSWSLSGWFFQLGKSFDHQHQGKPKGPYPDKKYRIHTSPLFDLGGTSVFFYV
jgi:hypothetical protein